MGKREAKLERALFRCIEWAEDYTDEVGLGAYEACRNIKIIAERAVGKRRQGEGGER